MSFLLPVHASVSKDMPPRSYDSQQFPGPSSADELLDHFTRAGNYDTTIKAPKVVV